MTSGLDLAAKKGDGRTQSWKREREASVKDGCGPRPTYLLQALTNRVDREKSIFSSEAEEPK